MVMTRAALVAAALLALLAGGAGAQTYTSPVFKSVTFGGASAAGTLNADGSVTITGVRINAGAAVCFSGTSDCLLHTGGALVYQPSGTTVASIGDNGVLTLVGSTGSIVTSSTGAGINFTHQGFNYFGTNEPNSTQVIQGIGSNSQLTLEGTNNVSLATNTGTPILTAAPTLITAAQPVALAAAATSAAPLNIPQGTAPTAPNNGDVWTTSGGLYVRIAGTTVGPLGTGGGGGGSPGGASGQIEYNNGGAFGGFTASGDATINTGTGAVTVSKIGGVSISLGGSFTTSGAYAVTLTATGATTVTLPTSGTLLTTAGNGGSLTGLAYSQLPALSANQLLGSLTATTPSGQSVPSCSGASNALTWTTGTGFGCNTISGGGATIPSGSTTNPLCQTATSGTAAGCGVITGPATSDRRLMP